MFRYWMSRAARDRSSQHETSYSPHPEHSNSSNMYTQIFSNYSFSSEILTKCQGDHFDATPGVASDVKNTHLIHVCLSLWMCATGATIWVYPQAYWMDLLGGLCRGGYAVFQGVLTFRKQKQILRKLPSDADVGSMVDGLLLHPKILKVVNVQYLLIEACGRVGVCAEILVDHMLDGEREELLRVVHSQLKEKADVIKIRAKAPGLEMIID